MAFVIIVGLLTTANASAKTEILSRRDLVNILTTASDHYQKIKTEDILRGDEDGRLRYDDRVTRMESLVMLRRAFGKFPALSENRLYADMADMEVIFSDIPDWARGDINSLIAAGVLVTNKDGMLHGDDFVTKSEIQTLLRRVWMLFGSNEKDDFFAAHEKEYINKAVKYPGQIGVGIACEVFDRQNKRVDELLNEIMAGQWEKGSNQQKIKDYYEAALAVCSGDVSDVSPVRAYFKDIDSAESLSALMDVIYRLYAESGISVALLSPNIDINAADSSKYIMWLSPDISLLDKDTYSREEVSKAAAEYYEKVFLIGGENPSYAKKAARDILDYQKALASVQIAPENRYDVEYYYNPMSLSDADRMLENIDLKDMLSKLGYSVPEKVAIDDLGAFRYLCSFVSDKNLAVIKNIVKFSILNKFGKYLSRDFYEAGLNFDKVIFGDAKPQTAKERARSFLLEKLDTEVGKMYVRKYFKQTDKDQLTEIEKVYIEVFRERIKALDWMKPETKEKAIKKLEAMTFKNIWPDYWFTAEESKYVPSFGIIPMAEGGSFFKNSFAVSKAKTSLNIAKEGTLVDKTTWNSSPLAINAYYYYTENCVYIMAGLMDYPFYDNSSIESLLGSMGAATIGHEITHAFDDGGAKFDETGSKFDWWTAEDYAAFKARCFKMEELFNHFEAAPGILANGKISVGENVADFGGLALSLDVVKKMVKNPDYKAFFRALADSWCYSYPRQTVSYYTAFEAHSMPWLRTNLPIMQSEEFYKAYGITEGDGMYLPPEERVFVW